MGKIKRKKSAYKLQKDKTWNAFSKYIRIRDCIKTTGTNNYGVCCTCNKQFEFKKLQAGHFIPNRRGKNLFEEKGVHAQCIGCNMFGGGRIAEYELYMKQNYGQDKIDDLFIQARELYKYTIFELKEMEADYKEKYNELLEG